MFILQHKKLIMKYAAIFALFALVFIVATVSANDASDESDEDYCGAESAAGAFCSKSKDAKACISCLVDNCHDRALKTDTTCQDILDCISGSSCQ